MKAAHAPTRSLLCALLIQPILFALAIVTAAAQNATLPPLPQPMGVPTPGPTNSGPYAPQPILPGGVVVTLFPPGSPYLNSNRVHEAEVYNMDPAVPGRIVNIVNIHNPSIEVHTVTSNVNTGTAIILVAGGGHDALYVGVESADFVPFFYNHGVNTIILRSRLRTSGYNPKTDEVYDAQQAIRLVRAHAKDWRLDPKKIGIMGFSAGAELATSAAVYYDDFDKKNSDPADPLAGISSRPDFVGVIYPGPSPFTVRGTNAPPAIPRNVPPSFIVCAGSGDQQHAVWADDYFRAMLDARVPNIEMHLYGRGHHPGDRVGPDEPPSTGGLTDRGLIAYGTWQDRFVDWFRELGFFQKAGVETQAAKDVATHLSQPQRGQGGRRGRRAGAGGTDTNAVVNPARASTPQAGVPTAQ